MRAVQLHAVEADAFRGGRGLGERADDGVQIGPGHRLAGALGAVDAQPGGSDCGGRRRTAAGPACGPYRCATAAARSCRRPRARPRRPSPACRLLLAVEPRDSVALPGRLVADVRALGDDQTHTRGGTAGVVRHHVLAGDAARRELTVHRGHHDPVGDREPVQRDRTGEDLGRAGGVVAVTWALLETTRAVDGRTVCACASTALPTAAPCPSPAFHAPPGLRAPGHARGRHPLPEQGVPPSERTG